MVQSWPSFSPGTRLPLDRVGIVKPDQSFAVRPMQRQRIFDSVRTCLAQWNAANDEPDPVPRFRVDHQHLPVQIQQCVKGRVPLHLVSLSDYHKDLHAAVLRIVSATAWP